MSSCNGNSLADCSHFDAVRIYSIESEIQEKYANYNAKKLVYIICANLIFPLLNQNYTKFQSLA